MTKEISPLSTCHIGFCRLVGREADRRLRGKAGESSHEYFAIMVHVPDGCCEPPQSIAASSLSLMYAHQSLILNIESRQISGQVPEFDIKCGWLIYVAFPSLRGPRNR